jgi:hypothetical protein
MKIKLPDSCPSCGGTIIITELSCTACGSQVKGSFALHPFRMLSQEQLAFIETFIFCRGSIREVEKQLGISYPTVRNRLNNVIQALTDARYMSCDNILAALENGSITAEQAAELIEQL